MELEIKLKRRSFLKIAGVAAAATLKLDVGRSVNVCIVG